MISTMYPNHHSVLTSKLYFLDLLPEDPIGTPAKEHAGPTQSSACLSAAVANSHRGIQAYPGFHHPYLYKVAHYNVLVFLS